MTGSGKLLLVVCSGNICRSPMAEYMVREALGEESCWEVRSAGTSAARGMPPSRSAVAVMKERGIDISAHRSRPLDAESIDECSLIVVMTKSHLAYVRSVVPGALERTFLLKSFVTGEGGAVTDPMGSSPDMYRSVRDEIEEAIPGLIDFMKHLQQQSENRNGDT
ncbi:MAG: low molecular weight protein arginine phosphatase [Kiritimatiellia bacterium]